MFGGHFKQKNHQQKKEQSCEKYPGKDTVYSMRTEIRRQDCFATSTRNMYTR